MFGEWSKYSGNLLKQKKTGIRTSWEILSFEIERHSVLFRLFDEKTEIFTASEKGVPNIY